MFILMWFYFLMKFVFTTTTSDIERAAGNVRLILWDFHVHKVLRSFFCINWNIAWHFLWRHTFIMMSQTMYSIFVSFFNGFNEKVICKNLNLICDNLEKMMCALIFYRLISDVEHLFCIDYIVHWNGKNNNNNNNKSSNNKLLPMSSSLVFREEILIDYRWSLRAFSIKWIDWNHLRTS